MYIFWCSISSFPYFSALFESHQKYVVWTQKRNLKPIRKRAKEKVSSIPTILLMLIEFIIFTTPLLLAVTEPFIPYTPYMLISILFISILIQLYKRLFTKVSKLSYSPGNPVDKFEPGYLSKSKHDDDTTSFSPYRPFTIIFRAYFFVATVIL